LAQFNPANDIIIKDDPHLTFAFAVITRTICNISRINHENASLLLKGYLKEIQKMKDQERFQPVGEFTDDLLVRFSN
jgi:hypothetical protein